MIEIIPNIHPILVHFTVAIIVLSGLLQIVIWSVSSDNSALISAQKWLLFSGTVAVIATVLTGLNAASTVNHDTASHLAIIDHRNWALPTAIIFLLGVAVFQLMPTKRSSVAGILFIASTALVSVTAFKGGELVYRYGIGVMALPEVSAEGHEHDAGAGEHEHEEAEQALDVSSETVTQAEEHDNSDGHSHEAEEQATTEPSLFSGLDNDAARTVIGFHAAINAGDVVKVNEMLDQSVLIFEGGGVERSAEEYAGHHLKADVAFLMKMTVTLIEHQVQASDNTAISMSRSRLVGKYNDKDIDINTMETIALRKINKQWKIVHIHWSN
jgi:uncharacterized membrane protein/ketosteroid isomerase-like protein